MRTILPRWLLALFLLPSRAVSRWLSAPFLLPNTIVEGWKEGDELLRRSAAETTASTICPHCDGEKPAGVPLCEPCEWEDRKAI
ncbi:hypothetical protein SAMN06297144_1428 [Sphingomonas guangdongensis]|uniref:Uncharacterized protein n=1 Tax=Sphingomonas guangdongensis TaxID=1141890 RepID=A0A285QI15_9SPHN|nr:hypothetical protein [Sphingomonas guangdongensis]SOB81158.1 hypothetical protein SAMN06297144_1428 [Sphingomonas guangdongensis]